MGSQRFHIHAPQVETLATRHHGHRNFADFGGGENEFYVLGRLLQRLQQGVEGVLGEHMHLVDDVDLVARRHRLVADALDQLTDVVHPGAAGRVHFDHVHIAVFGDGHAMFTLAAGFLSGATAAVCADTVECAGDDSRRGGLSHAAYAGENKGVGETAAGDGIGENPDHDLLADEIGEGLGTVFPRQYTIGPGIRQGGFLVF